MNKNGRLHVIQGRFKHIRTLWEYTTAKRVLFGVAGQLNLKFIVYIYLLKILPVLRQYQRIMWW